MCAHYTIQNVKLVDVAAAYGVHIPARASQGFVHDHFYPSRGKAVTLVPAVRVAGGKAGLHLFRWDLVPSWWRKPTAEKKFSSFNARSDSLTTKATFKGAWKYSRRCIMPATSFFEWPDKDMLPPDAKRTEKEIRLEGQPLIAIAGLWDECEIADTELVLSCAMITTDANAAMAALPHDRMPVILSPQDCAEWLNPATTPARAFEMLKPCEHADVRIL